MASFAGSKMLKSELGGATIETERSNRSVFPSFVRTFPTVTIVAAILMISGLLHLAWLWRTGAEWEGPLSLRKPALFGISGGMTVFSISWVLTKLTPNRFDRLFANTMAFGLLLEVGLITIQQWRGVASHFNRSTNFDALIELTMLVLISIVTMGICWLAIRSIFLPEMPDETQLAIRSGLWLLVAACALGFIASFLGELSAASGKSPTIWGPAGVLKYPHGAALHAIQLLPMTAWLMNRLRVRHVVRQLSFILAGQILFLCQALWQTFQGRSRLDIDWVGGGLLVFAGLLFGTSGMSILVALFGVIVPKRTP